MAVGFPWRRLGSRKGSAAGGGSAARKGSTSARARALAALLLPAVLLPVAPAYAGGALIVPADRRLTVTREVSVVRWDGAREQIVTRLTVAGDAGRAAWLLPVPARATVKLGERRLRRLGPFDVTHLSAADPAAWLRASGTPYLTVVAQELPAPLATDHALHRAPSDAPVRQTVYADQLRTFAGIPAWLLTVAAVILALAATAIRLALRGERTGGALRTSTTLNPPGPQERSTAPMTATTEEPRPAGLTARVTDALEALRARVRSEPSDTGALRAGTNGIPPMPTQAPTVGVPPRPGTAPAGGFPPMPEVMPTVGVPPMPEGAPVVGAPGEGFAVYDAPSADRSTPRVPPMPSAAPTVPPVVPPVPSYDPRAGGSSHLHKYPFCAPPLNRDTFGSRQKHRRVQQVPRQGDSRVSGHLDRVNQGAGEDGWEPGAAW